MVLSSSDIHSKLRSVFLVRIISAMLAFKKPIPHCFRYSLSEYLLIILIAFDGSSSWRSVKPGRFLPVWLIGTHKIKTWAGSPASNGIVDGAYRNYTNNPGC